jgi:hypothetical protein
MNLPLQSGVSHFLNSVAICSTGSAAGIKERRSRRERGFPTRSIPDHIRKVYLKNEHFTKFYWK